MSKSLIFEGAGWAGADTSEATDVTNCRIRTRLRNNNGRVIYLEILGHKYQGKDIPAWGKGFNVVGWVDACFYDDAKWDSRRNYSKELTSSTKVRFEYTKENILKFVNSSLNCSFDDMQVINEGLHVFNTQDSVCDSNNGDYIPYIEPQTNISMLANIEPLFKCRNANSADYYLTWGSVNKIAYLAKWMNKQSSKEQGTFKQMVFYARIRWDMDGIITNLEISARGMNFGCFGLGSEDVQQVINLILKDNKQTVEAEAI